jgi:lysophospholipase L1-like esterase
MMPFARPRPLLAVMLGLAAVLAASVSPADAASPTEVYAALGDSAASGNGTRNPDLSWTCYRSSDAYGPIIEDERNHTDLVFPACQGAETGDILASQQYSVDADTDWITISIGGNDVGFSDLIFNCYADDDTDQCLQTVEEVNGRIENDLGDKLDDTYAALLGRAPKATIMAIGYPRFFGDDLSCADADGIVKEEAVALNGVADNLDAKIGERAAAAGIVHVSVVEQFTGHDVCADPAYVNGKAEWNMSDMYHPSPEGYRDGYMPLIRDIMG